MTKETMQVFQKEYCEESIIDLEYDVWDLMRKLKDQTLYNIPIEDGLIAGKLEVTINWSEE